MKRQLVVGDIHGHIKELKSVLKAAAYNPDEDDIVFIGDYIDRGPDSYEAYRLVRNIVESSDTAVALRGNHEELMIRALATRSEGDTELWAINGSTTTKNSFRAANKPLNDAAVWFQQLPYICETETFVFVHGGIVPSKSLKDQSPEDLVWLRPESFLQELDKCEWLKGRKLVVGHTPTLAMTKGIIVPIVTDHCIFVDTGVHCGGRLSLFDLTNDLVYQAGKDDKKEVR